MSRQVINNLQQRGNAFSVVLHDSGADVFKSASHIFTKMMCSGKDLLLCAVIEHSMDYDQELKQYKPKHYHMVLTFDGCYRVQTIINLIIDQFHCNLNQVGCEKVNSVPKQIRYLIHLDDFDKYQYSKSGIVTNKSQAVEEYLSLVTIYDLNDCVRIVQKYRYDLEKIMTSVTNYDSYRKYINDLIVNFL